MLTTSQKLLLLLLIRHFKILLNVNNITKAPAVFSFQSRHETIIFETNKVMFALLL